MCAALRCERITLFYNQHLKICFWRLFASKWDTTEEQFDIRTLFTHAQSPGNIKNYLMSIVKTSFIRQRCD